MPTTRATTSVSAAQQIGRLIRDLRKQRHLTGEQLAQKSAISQSRVSKIENGYSESFDPAQIENILNILKAPKIIRQQISILMLRRNARLESQFNYPFAFPKDVLEWNKHTKVFRSYLVCAVPTILQIPEYRQALIRKLGLSEQDVATELGTTVLWQDYLWDTSKTFYFLMPEADLYTLPAGASVQIAQLDRLERLIGLKRIRIGIIPVQMGSSVFETSSFTVHDDRIAETYVGDRILKFQDTETILKYMNAFAELEQKAVYDDEAVALIRKAADYFTV